MGSPDEILVGVLGLGVVGSGVVQALENKKDTLISHVGCRVGIGRVLVRDFSKSRNVEIPQDIMTTQASDILDDPDIAVIVELMGGERPALDYIQEALSRGKHVITANKEVMAKHGPDLLALAADKGVRLLFEASVGGGIPIIGPLRRDLLANDIKALRAIINGTTNFVLTRMAREGVEFDVALREAQSLGYAEADPTNDVMGVDAAYKLSVLATLAFHTEVRAGDVYCEGIERLSSEDFRYAQELGYAIKLLAIGHWDDSGLQLRVHPALVPLAHLLAKVDGVFNAIEVEGDLVGRVVFHGQGAGALPTSSAVVADVMEVARGITTSGVLLATSHRLDRGLRIKSMGDLKTKFYLRLNILDKPRVLAQIAEVLGDLNVSIASVIQKETGDHNGTADLVITTHLAIESSVQEALERIAHLSGVCAVKNFIRVED
jgi:homoserine dehydrogenase